MTDTLQLLHTDEGRRAARILEWSRLLASVASHCALTRAAQRIEALMPRTDPTALREDWSWVEEFRVLLAHADEIPLGSFEDLHDLVGEERRERGLLDGEELAAVAGAARTLGEMLAGVRDRGDRLPRTARCVRGCEDPLPLAERLQAALEPDGRLKDSASPRLGGLRRVAAGAEARMRDAARREMEKASSGGHTMSGEIVMRGSRLCIPVRAGARTRVPGIVHDRSGTGGTLFIEPIAVVEASNEAAEARLAVEDEERRILVELNRAVGERTPHLLALFERAVEIDAVRARARWGRAHGGEIPQLSTRTDAPIRLHQFRHPLLQESLAAAGRAADLVPLDLFLADARMVLVSGPNAGGKTVSLKSMGLAALMAQSGIPLPCTSPPQLPIFDHVLCDVGDEQSIADALSSFSGHLAHLRRILELATPRSLVLLDEVGGGTDPQEGVAIARALLEHLARGGARTFVTTHYGQLKALVQEDRAFRHASMEFDHERLVPLFSLQLDVPGASHALEIAERMGLPEEVLTRARELVGDDRLRLDELLRTMEQARREAEAARDALTREIDENKLSRQKFDLLAREMKEQRRTRLDAAEREAEGIVRNARKRVEKVLQEIREAGGNEQAVEAARRAREEIEVRADRLRERLDQRQRPEPERRPARIELQALARHAQLDKVGRIVEIRGERVTLEVGGTRLVARADQLVAPDAVDEATALRPVEGTIRTQLVDASPLAATQVDVRGCDTEDAWRLVDRAVDRCLVTGMRELEVVHGKGTGKLRQMLGERLGRDPRIRSARLGGDGRFDDGVTLVQL